MGSRRIPLYYRSREIENLPCKVHNINEDLWLDYLKDNEIPEAYILAKEAAVNGLNIGTNEYRNLKEFDFMLSDAEAFTFKDDSGKIQGVVAMHPCWLSRSCSSCLVTLVVIPSMCLYKKHCYGTLVNIGCKLIVELDLHYELCVMNVFVACSDIALDLSKEGFNSQLLIPNAGTLKGYGLQDSFIMIKDLKIRSLRHRSLDEVCAMYEKCKVMESNDDIIRRLPKIPFLPLALSNQNGLAVQIRNVSSEKDLKTFCELFLLTSQEGDGFGIDEFPSFTYLSRIFIEGQYVTLYEDLKTGKCIGGVAIQPHWSQRTREGQSADSAVAIHPDYQGNKQGTFLLFVYLIIVKKLGFKASMSEVLTTNTRMIKLITKMKYKILGTIPKTAYVKHKGWVGSLITYLDLNDFPDDFNEFEIKCKL